jgi:hypothetical protein
MQEFKRSPETMNLLWNPMNLKIGQIKENLKAIQDQADIEDYWLTQWGYEIYLMNVREVYHGKAAK